MVKYPGFSPLLSAARRNLGFEFGGGFAAGAEHADPRQAELAALADEVFTVKIVAVVTVEEADPQAVATAEPVVFIGERARHLAGGPVRGFPSGQGLNSLRRPNGCA